MTLFWLGICAGFFLGMLFHNLLVQVAYRRRIIEYKGIKK